jgi:hypothetical protein
MATLGKNMNSDRIAFIYGLVFGAAAVIALNLITQIINPESIHVKIINNSEKSIEKAIVETDRRIYGHIGNDFSMESDTAFTIVATQPITYKTTVIFSNGEILTHTSPSVEAGWVIYEYVEEGVIRTHIRSK